MKENENILIELTEKAIESMIYEIRGQKVMLDFDLARIYGYETKSFNQQVKNNIFKFPTRYRFQLTRDEIYFVRSKKFTSKRINKPFLDQHGGTRYLPFAFTEQGIYMLMTVLKGELATRQSIALIDAFKSMKDYLVENRPLLGQGELIHLVQTVDEHGVAIAEMKNDLKAVMDNFIDTSTYKHFVIFAGEKLEADLAYQDIYAKAKASIIIVDDYVGVKTLQLLKSSRPGVDITIITDNKARNGLTASFVEDSKLSIAFKRNDGLFHDRYIILDYHSPDEKIYHCGASSKDAGKSIAAINEVSDISIYHPSLDLALSHPTYTIG